MDYAIDELLYEHERWLRNTKFGDASQGESCAEEGQERLTSEAEDASKLPHVPS